MSALYIVTHNKNYSDVDGNKAIRELEGLNNSIAQLRSERDALKAAVDEARELIVNLASLVKYTDDMRVIARVMGGTSKAADQYIERANKIDKEIDKCRSWLEAHNKETSQDAP